MNPLSNECATLIVATGQFGLVTFGNADSVDVRSEMSVRYECEYSYECLFVFAFPCTFFSTLFSSLHPCAMRQTAGNFPLNVLDTRDFQRGSKKETGEGQEGAAEGTSCWQDTAVALAAG